MQTLLQNGSSRYGKNDRRPFYLFLLSGLILACVFLPSVHPSLLQRTATETATSTIVASTLTPTQPSPTPTRTLLPTRSAVTSTPLHLLLPTAAEPLIIETRITPSPESSFPGDHAELLYQDPPDWIQVKPKEEFLVTWGIRNDGSTTWNTNYLLMFAGETWVTQYGAFQSPIIRPGEQTEFHVWIKAPPEIGEYTTRWAVVDPNHRPILNLEFKFKVVL
jgi:hypothetical protein